MTMRASHNVKDVEPKSILVRKFGKSENCKLGFTKVATWTEEERKKY